MQPIADMEDDQFMKLQELYATELPICPVSSLEDTRQVLSWLLFEALQSDADPDAVRGVIEQLVCGDRRTSVEPERGGAGRSDFQLREVQSLERQQVNVGDGNARALARILSLGKRVPKRRSS